MATLQRASSAASATDHDAEEVEHNHEAGGQQQPFVPANLLLDYQLRPAPLEHEHFAQYARQYSLTSASKPNALSPIPPHPRAQTSKIQTHKHLKYVCFGGQEIADILDQECSPFDKELASHAILLFSKPHRRDTLISPGQTYTDALQEFLTSTLPAWQLGISEAKRLISYVQDLSASKALERDTDQNEEAILRSQHPDDGDEQHYDYDSEGSSEFAQEDVDDLGDHLSSLPLSEPYNTSLANRIVDITSEITQSFRNLSDSFQNHDPLQPQPNFQLPTDLTLGNYRTFVLVQVTSSPQDKEGTTRFLSS